jgi:lysyl-tRNA synthetase class 2
LLELASIGSLYERAIVDTDRQPEFLFFVAFLLTFGFIRTSAHLIRAQVSWWPGNVEVGGTHIHHLVWGILLLLIAGYVGVAIAPPSPWHEIVTVLFGVGTGLTLDEFALWLNLKDVYWSQQGRRSIDAVIVATTVTGMVLVGFTAWVDVATEVEDAVFALVGAFGVITIGAVVVNLAKEKFGMAIVGLFIPPVGVVGALRLGRPGSLWARLYRESKRGRARARFGEQAPPSPVQPAPSQSAAGSG